MGLDVTADHATFLKIPLVVLFGLPERGGWNDLRRDGFPIRAGGVQLGDFRAGLGELLIVVCKDDAAVLRTPILTLAVDLGGIMHGEERVQQRVVSKTGWIEGDFDDFPMSGAVGTAFFIG